MYTFYIKADGAGHITMVAEKGNAGVSCDARGGAKIRRRADVTPGSRRRCSNSARIFARSSARIARNTGISFLGHHIAPTSRRCRADVAPTSRRCRTDVARTPRGFSRAPQRASQETPEFPFSATIYHRCSA